MSAAGSVDMNGRVLWPVPVLCMPLQDGTLAVGEQARLAAPQAALPHHLHPHHLHPHHQGHHQGQGHSPQQAQPQQEDAAAPNFSSSHFYSVKRLMGRQYKGVAHGLARRLSYQVRSGTAASTPVHASF